jgi:hypothetical protein
MAGERVTPGSLNINAFWTLGSGGYKDQLDTNFLNLSVLVQPYVLSSLGALPGSPADGDIHLMTGGANVNQIAIRDNGAWLYLVPYDGFMLYERALSKYITFNGTAWLDLSLTAPYDMRVAFSGTPGDAAVIDKIHAVRDIVLGADMIGSIGSVGVNPTAIYTIEVQDDGTAIGTISISTGGAVTFTTTSGTAKTIASGSVITFVSQATADATVDQGSITLKATS